MVDQAAVELIKVKGVAGEIPIVPDCAGQGPETVGSVHHVLAGVTFAPPDWTIGPDGSAAVSANTIGVLTTDDGAIPQSRSGEDRGDELSGWQDGIDGAASKSRIGVD